MTLDVMLSVAGFAGAFIIALWQMAGRIINRLDLIVLELKHVSERVHDLRAVVLEHDEKLEDVRLRQAEHGIALKALRGAK